MKLAVLIWMILATVFAGAALTAIVSVPSLAGQAIRLIPIACGAAVVIAIPIAMDVSKRIRAVTHED